MPEPCRVLFFPEGERFLYEFAPLINRLVVNPEVRVLLLTDGEPFRLVGYPDADAADQISDRVAVVARPPRSCWGLRRIAAVEDWAKRWYGEWADRILNLLPFVLLLAAFDVVDLIADRRQAKRVLRALRPDVLVLARDRNLGLSMALLRGMQALGKAVVLAPWGFVNTAFLVANRVNSPRNIVRPPAWLVVHLAMTLLGSRYLFCHEGITYCFYKPGRYLAAAATGLCPRNPWFFGSDANACLVDGNATAGILRNGGVPAERIRVTGNQIYDSLFLSEESRSHRRVEIARKYGCCRRVLILALPHLGEHKLLPWDRHWQEMDFLLAAFTEQAVDADVLISLHPRCERARYEDIAVRFGVRILDEPLKAVLPVADAFACQWSGTTAWGVALGCPTLVLDFYGIGSLGYEYLESGIVRVAEREDLPQGIGRLLAGKPSVPPPGMPTIDGRSTERVCAAILEKAGR